MGGILVYTGVDVDPATDAILGSLGATGSSTTVNAPSITGPFAAGSQVIRFYGNDKEFAVTTAALGTIYQARRPKSGGGFEKPSGAAAHAAQAVAGPTGTVAGSNGGQGGNWVAQTVVLKMAPSNATPTLTNVPISAIACSGVLFASYDGGNASR